MKTNKIPYRYRSFVNFYLTLILPISIVATIVIKLYYNGGIQVDPLKKIDTWVFFVLFQILFGFFIYIWDFVPKVKKYKSKANETPDSERKIF